MEQVSYPPPPPATGPTSQRGVHGPRTHFFSNIRVRLAYLEHPSQLAGGNRPNFGLIVSLLISATLGFGLSYALQTGLTMIFQAGMDPASIFYLIGIFFAPLTEEPSKALAMLIVAFVMWKVVPNRRYGAALGAAAGLGFGVAESILYIFQIAVSNLPEIAAIRGEAIAIRVIVTPFMHPLWSAFVGIGVFALVANRHRRTRLSKSPTSLPMLFLLLGMLNHLVWNSVSLGLSQFGYLPIVINLLVTFPLFAIVLRDFLGGHFNFQNFFEPLAEPMAAYPAMPPPPPLQ